MSIFSNKIKCADCGGWYGSKVWHSTDRYDTAKARYDEVVAAISANEAQSERLADFIKVLI